MSIDVDVPDLTPPSAPPSSHDRGCFRQELSEEASHVPSRVQRPLLETLAGMRFACRREKGRKMELEQHIHTDTVGVARRKSSGRPRLPRDRRRKHRIEVRATGSELLSLRLKALRARRPLARFMREAALGHRVRVADPGTVATAAELGRIGHNLNQALRLANGGRVPVWPAGDMERLREICFEVGARLNNIRHGDDGVLHCSDSCCTKHSGG